MNAPGVGYTMWGLIHNISHRILHRAYRMLYLRPRKQKWRRKNRGKCTYAEWHNEGTLASYTAGVDPALLAKYRYTIAATSELYLAHRFDLLGSGWVEVKHGMKCNGFEEYHYAQEPSVQADREGAWLKGRINPTNLDTAQRIWQQIAADNNLDNGKFGYIPIDWQLDFKSGFRWSEQAWYQDIEYGHIPGADAKVPWELGRMQHVIQFAWAYALSKEEISGFRTPAVYAQEFRNQVLDFIATNPPQFGVQWRSTMDVAIRVSDWLITYDIFRAYGEEFDEAFNAILARSVYEHGNHIVQNLEWSARLRHNHYLANIVGLLFASAYLPPTSQTNTWLAFAVRELVHEVRAQFHGEGTNFEGSVCYHRLSAEMAVYATALVLGLPQERLDAIKGHSAFEALREMGVLPFLIRLYRASQPERRWDSGQATDCILPSWYLARLEKMAEFTMHITKQNGHVPQIGDNDSGRFLKAMPEYQRMRCDKAKTRFGNLADWRAVPGHDILYLEDHLSHRHLVAAVYGLFPRHDFVTFCGDTQVDTCLIRALTGRSKIASHLSDTDKMQAETRVVGTKHDRDILENRLGESSRYKKGVTIFDVSGLATGRLSLTHGLRTYAYPEFGVYIVKSSRLFLAIRCGRRGREGQGGHDHNDQLSIEITIDGVDWVTDPGTYVYSALPERRDQYRSVKAHFAPRIGDLEPAPLDQGLFALPGLTKGEAIYFDPTGFAGMHYGYGAPIYRFISLDDSRVTVTDYVPRKQAGTHPATRLMQNPVKNAIAFSPGYGILVNLENVGPERHGTENIAMTGGER